MEKNQKSQFKGIDLEKEPKIQKKIKSENQYNENEEIGSNSSRLPQQYIYSYNQPQQNYISDQQMMAPQTIIVYYPMQNSQFNFQQTLSNNQISSIQNIANQNFQTNFQLQQKSQIQKQNFSQPNFFQQPQNAYYLNQSRNQIIQSRPQEQQQEKQQQEQKQEQQQPQQQFEQKKDLPQKQQKKQNKYQENQIDKNNGQFSVLFAQTKKKLKAEQIEQPLIVYLLYKNLKKSMESMRQMSHQVITLKNLKSKQEFVINELYYNMKYPCSSCGARFSAIESLKNHLDEHFQENFEIYEKKNNKKMSDRKNCLSIEEWISSKPQQKPNYQTQTQILENCEHWIEATQQNLRCDLCSELFKLNWHSKMQIWIYEETVKVEITSMEVPACDDLQRNYNFFHFNCFKILQEQEEFKSII